MSQFTDVITQVFTDFIDLAIGHTSISDIGDGTLKGAVRNLQTNKAPTDHSSVSSGYGLAETTKYGHTKVIDGLTSNTFTNGEALSAYQGYVLKDLIDSNLAGFGYGTCSTAADNTNKSASLTDYDLKTNGIVSIKFTNAVQANSTLSINSKTAKAIYHKGSPLASGVIEAGDTATFIYNTYYHLISIDKVSSGGGGGGAEISFSLTEPSNKSADLIWAGGE